MGLQEIAVATLLSVSSLLGVKPVAEDKTNWQVTSEWHEFTAGDSPAKFMRLDAESTTLPALCKQNPDSYISFPAVIHGSHEIKLDGRLILQFGDPSFQTMRSFFGAPFIACKEVAAGTSLQWSAFSYTKYFARISFFPQLTSRRPIYNVFAETFHIIGAGAGLLMAIFTFTLFAGKISRRTTISVCLASFFSTFYLGGCVAGFMGLPWSMLTTHKIADVGVWISICSLVAALQFELLVSPRVLWIYAASCVLAVVIILAGETGDLVQFGTTIPFSFTLFVLAVPMVKLGHSLAFNGLRRGPILQFLSLGSFVLAVFNEMFAVTGLIHSSPMLPFGFMAGVMFLTLSVNEKIGDTYRERDYLRQNLENEVERQTRELKTTTAQLETAMHDLKSTQAELVQSAKLASLGTLSAGIAHEINNSLNFVSGALRPLELLVAKSPNLVERDKINKLFGAMRDGLQLTLEIIKSLRSYTGLNQAKFNDVALAKVVQSVLIILKAKLRSQIAIHADIPASLKIYGSVVGLNQIVMNLVSNAIDAMPEGGDLTISAQESDATVTIKISDTGKGIPTEHAQRIFDPFFTTKEVGKGTGLGLHIVKGEVERHQGTIQVDSVVGKGTSFTICIPQPVSSVDQSRAA